MTSVSMRRKLNISQLMTDRYRYIVDLPWRTWTTVFRDEQPDPHSSLWRRTQTANTTRSCQKPELWKPMRDKKKKKALGKSGRSIKSAIMCIWETHTGHSNLLNFAIKSGGHKISCCLRPLVWGIIPLVSTYLTQHATQLLERRVSKRHSVTLTALRSLKCNPLYEVNISKSV